MNYKPLRSWTIVKMTLHQYKLNFQVYDKVFFELENSFGLNAHSFSR